MRLMPTIAAVLLAAASPAVAADASAPVQPAAASTAPTVTVAPAVRSEVQWRVPLSGTLVARQVVHVFPQLSGMEIVALHVEPGDRVTKGQELARLSDETVRAQLAQAEAELQRATAGVSQAESQIVSADAALKQAATALERARSLRRSGSGSQAALDQATADEAAAHGAAASARDGLAVARAIEAQAKAARDIAKLNLDWTRILSPVDGRVTARAAKQGAIASAGGEPMFQLIADGTIEFEGEVIESSLPSLKPGQRAELNVAGVGPVVGELRQLPAAVDPTTRLGLVRVSLPDDAGLLTGLFASGDIITLTRTSVTVPATAILSQEDGERVQVVRDGVVETREIKGGLLWQGRREVLEGLAEGETVISRAGAFFGTGDVVKVASEPDPAAKTGSGADPAAEKKSADGTAQQGDPAKDAAAPAGSSGGSAGPGAAHAEDGPPTAAPQADAPQAGAPADAPQAGGPADAQQGDAVPADAPPAAAEARP